MKADILAFGAHPDDIELGCGGTIIKHAESGKMIVLADLTYGELGTRGDVETRKAEAEKAAKLMGVKHRLNLGFRDGFFKVDEEHILKVIQVIRKFKPEVVLANAITDRHPDHGRGAELVRQASFLSGLRRIETIEEGIIQESWRPKNVYHYIQALDITPDFVVDVTGYAEKKKAAVLAHKSQFYQADSKEPETFISSPEFLDFNEARMMHWGMPAGAKLAEGFTVVKPILVQSLFDLG